MRMRVSISSPVASLRIISVRRQNSSAKPAAVSLPRRLVFVHEARLSNDSEGMAAQVEKYLKSSAFSLREVEDCASPPVSLAFMKKQPDFGIWLEPRQVLKIEDAPLRRRFYRAKGKSGGYLTLIAQKGD